MIEATMKSWVTAAVLLYATAAYGQETKPAADDAGPKATMRAYAEAFVRGDGKAMADLMAAANPAEQRMASASGGYAECLFNLHQAMSAKFGVKPTAEQLGDYDAMKKQMLEQIDTAVEKIDGDGATLKLGDAPQDTQYLTKVDGKWKISVSSITKGSDPDKIMQTVTTTEKATAAVKDLTKDVTDGKFSTALAAGEALRQKVNAVGAPTTAPAAGAERAPPEK